MNLTDIGFISELGNLKKLDLSNNKISNIDNINYLLNLETLVLEDNMIKDISSIDSLKDIKNLNLKQNLLTSGDILSDLKQLERLYIDDNNVADISKIVGLPNLIDFTYSGNPINENETDSENTLEFESKYFEDLVRAELFDYPLEITLDMLKGVCNLNIFELQLSNKEQDYLKFMTNMKVLNIYDSNIKDFSFLNEMPYLEVLELASLSNTISVDLTNNKFLVNLSIEDCNIGKISDLSQNQLLNRLTIWKSNLTTVDFIEKVLNLEYLNLSNNQLDDLPILAITEGLKTLNLSHNQIENLDGLRLYNNLEELYITNNLITDFTELTQLNRLRVLFIENNKSDNYSPLESIITRLEKTDITTD